jgi:hypothetical protein
LTKLFDFFARFSCEICPNYEQFVTKDFIISCPFSGQTRLKAAEKPPFSLFFAGNAFDFYQICQIRPAYFVQSAAFRLLGPPL